LSGQSEPGRIAFVAESSFGEWLRMRSWLPALVVVGALPWLAQAAGVPPAPSSPRLFQPPRRPALPAVKDAVWPRNSVDRFILARLEAKDLAPNRPASRLRLLRRVTHDLTGLPPTVEEQRAFLADTRPGAYERLVDRLLASPHLGERWAQHWLDLVRYAETDGFKEDALRPNAHRYRDWVIAALNDNLPYDTFVQWQLAGDELAPGNAQALIATGFNRLWPDEYNAANLEQRRQEILDDTIDTTGLVFLGLTVGCARCHDHKYDPLSQRDYFRLQSFFAALQPRELPLPGPALEAYRQQRATWESATRHVRDEIDRLLAPKRRRLHASALEKFRAEIQEAVRTAPERRTPYQWQIALMALKQADSAARAAPARLSAEEKKLYQELQKKLAALGAPPAPPLTAMATTDIGPVAPPTHRLIGGDWHKPAAEVRPGFPAFLGKAAPDMHLPAGVPSTGRRAALARWLTRPDHPLTARVMVNRLWQHHFGQGIVATASDFGAQGTPPTHPELLDWLAVELVESGWDLKRIHRLLVTSAAYRQDSTVDSHNPHHARALAVDRGNDLLWHARRRRLEGEAIRDAILALSGELNARMFGPSARPVLPANLSKYAWKPDGRPHDRHRRSVYVMARRNLRFPLFDAFDLPDMHNSCSRRLTTTTAPQALLLLNGDLGLGHARTWAEALRARHGDDPRAIVRAGYRAAWCRPADDVEVKLALRFLNRQAGDQGDVLADFCHALLNTNEFVYLD
jgi:hypothetical protein